MGVYLRPGNLDQALDALSQRALAIVAGGTDFYPARVGQPLDDDVLDISAIAGLGAIEERGDDWRIGALATWSDLIAAELPPCFDGLKLAAHAVGGVQIQNAGTVAGNLCNASPAGDMIIPLLLLDAEVELASWNEGAVIFRRIPLAEFFTGPGATRKQHDELLTAIEFVVPESGFVAGFYKSGPRPALEIATVSLGVAGVLKNGALHAARVAIGAAAPTALRALRVEAALEGQRLDDSLITKAADLAAEEATPIDDMRASAWYRRHLIRVFAGRLLHDVIANSN